MGIFQILTLVVVLLVFVAFIKFHIPGTILWGGLGLFVYMMFVYKCKDKRLKNVCSVDNYSRIQTLERQFNPKYYDLINAFKKLTGLPAVLNTSLNLPGRVLCEDTNDLYFMMKNSSLKYCYLCDENKLLWLT